MLLYRFFLALTFFLRAIICNARVTGSDTVCAGYIYTFNVNIPGASSYTWTVPATWYNIVGQGASQMNVTCNGCAGPVCAEGFDSFGISVGTQCLLTIAGAPSGGGGTWHLSPSGNNAICDNVPFVNVTPVIVNDGGGGGCQGNCGGAFGYLNPNLVFALYSGQLYQGPM
ncbi:hypothetical protein BH11BAC1_BH11BAC1_27820 [soil metagenome]